MQRGCHGWPASRELSELFLAGLKGRAFVCFSFFFFCYTLPKILEILLTGSGLGGKKKCCVTPLHTGSESILGVLVGPARALYRLKSSYVLLKEEPFVFGVPHGGWSEPPSSGSLVMEGFWLQEVGWCVSRKGFLSL